MAATALAAALWPVAPAHAGGDSGGVVAVFTHFEDDGSVAPSSIPCPGGQAVRGDATFGVEPGDTWHGTSVYDFCLVPGSTPNSFTFSGIETFTGTVDGCGTGSSVLAHGGTNTGSSRTTACRPADAPVAGCWGRC